MPAVDYLPYYPKDNDPDDFDAASLAYLGPLEDVDRFLDFLDFEGWVGSEAATDCGLLPEDLADMGGVPW